MAATDAFEHWFPSYKNGIERILHSDCQDKLQDYANGSSSQCIGVDWPKNCVAGVVVDCLLTNMPESWKSSMAGSAVLLGVLPSLISLLGSSTVELGLLSLQRPLLAFLLSIGTPAIGQIRALEYKDLPELLEKHKESIGLPRMSHLSAIAVSAVQYIIACACVANVALVNWQLCIATVNSIAPATQFLPAFWHLTAILVYIVGTIAVFLRFRMIRTESTTREKGNKSLNSLMRALQPCRQHPDAKLQPKKESWLFIFMAWLAYVGGVAHIVIATLLFSSILFIGVGDAAIVVVRYCVSTAVCRIIFQIEMYGMRETIRPDDKGVYDTTEGDQSEKKPMIYNQVPI